MGLAYAFIALALLGCLLLVAAAQHVADRRVAAGRWVRGLASATLGGGVARSVVVLAIVPALALTVMTAGRRAADLVERDRVLVAESATGAARQIENFLARHTAGVRAAAESIGLDGRPEAARLEQWLLKHHPIYPDFLTMLAAGADGRIASATRWTAGRAEAAAAAGRSVADRSYFRVPMLTGEDYVSPAFRGRGLGTDPLIAISSAVTIGGERCGIVEGSLNLNAFGRLGDNYRRLLDADVVLVDAHGTIVYASAGSGYDFLERAGSLPIGRVLGGTAVETVEARDGSGPLLVGHARTAQGWHVLILRSQPTVGAMLAEVWEIAAVWLAACAIAAGALGWTLARRVTQPMKRLGAALDAYEVGQPSPFRTVERLPVEYREVFRHLHRFAVRHAARHRDLAHSLANAERLQSELQSVLEQREHEIVTRTRELAAANRELQRLSRTDALTGLPNRRAFEESYERLWRLAAREGGPVAILVLDVDRFKAYNDTYGHPAGDEVLKRIATALPGCLNRPADVAARYGGEEFVVVLGDTGVEGAGAVAERIRSEIARLGIPHEHSHSGVVSVSVGVAATRPTPAADAESLLRRADAALYRAKTLGRDRVAVDPASEWPAARLVVVSAN